MKKITLASIALSVLAIAACNKENLDSPVPEETPAMKNIEFTASSMDTKTILEGVQVLWCAGDEISVAGATAAFTTDIAEKSATAVFKGTAAPVAGKYYAAYPFSAVSAWEGTSAAMTLPAAQQAVANTFENGLNLAVATATEAEKALQFKNLLSYVSFIIPEGDEVINTVKVISTGNLAGEFKADAATGAITVVKGAKTVSLTSAEKLAPGKYYIAMLPGNNTNTLTFEFSNAAGKTSTLPYKVDQMMEAGHIYNIGEIKLHWGKPEFSKTITVDGDFSDWEKLDPAKVAVATCTDNAAYPLRALKTLKVYACGNLLNIYLECDATAKFSTLHVFMNADNNDATGGNVNFEGANSEIMLEGPIDNCSQMNYFRWNDALGKGGWNWDGKTVQSWEFMTGASDVNKTYEFQVNLTNLKDPAKGNFTFADTFGLAVEVQPGWDPAVGRLPNGWPTKLLPVTFDK